LYQVRVNRDDRFGIDLLALQLRRRRRRARGGRLRLALRRWLRLLRGLSRRPRWRGRRAGCCCIAFVARRGRDSCCCARDAGESASAATDANKSAAKTKARRAVLLITDLAIRVEPLKLWPSLSNFTRRGF
jgi:hypothetical protein